jgi:hypothetical protein
MIKLMIRKRGKRIEETLPDIVTALQLAGLNGTEIQRALMLEETSNSSRLKQLARELGGELQVLQKRLFIVAKMLQIQAVERLPSIVDGKSWETILRSAGMNQAAMNRWHSKFEQVAPEEHRQFLVDLGLSEDEIQQIRQVPVTAQ